MHIHSRTLAIAGVLTTSVLAAVAAPAVGHERGDTGDVCHDARSGALSTSADITQTRAGVAVTEYRDRGSYRVVSCTASGELVRAVTAEPHRLPDGSVAWLPHEVERPGADGPVSTVAEFGDFRLYDGDWRAAVRELKGLVPAPASPSRLTPHRLPALSDDPAVLAQARRVASGEELGFRFQRGEQPPAPQARLQDVRCSTGDYAYSGWFKNSATHLINLSPIGPQYHADFIQNINEGFNAWQYTYNICGFPAVGGVTASTAGWTQIPAATADGGSGNNDGVEVVDAGMLAAGSCNGALACAYRYGNLRHDVRMSQSYPWCNGWCPGFYDIWSVIAHEAGHVYGFDHAANNNMVMGPSIAAGDAGKRYLWWGDYQGLSAVY